MAYRFSKLAVRAGFVAALAVLLATGLRTSPANATEWPSEVDAVYDIKFSGLDIGDFNFKSRAGPQGYTLDGNSKLSVFFGAFKWRGVFKTTGSIENGAPKPAGYSFDYRSGSKRGSVKMNFDPSGVSDVTLDPPKKPSSAAVPLNDQHLKNVLDPLSAIMAMTQGGTGKTCRRRLAVFDGKHRFDLELLPRGGASEAAANSSGQGNGGIVCRVQYHPIAGHKPNKESQALSEGNIEVALAPAGNSNLILPQRITIPTAWGEAELVSKRIDIVAGGQKRTAHGGE